MGDDTDKFEAWEKEARKRAREGDESRAIKALQWSQPKSLKSWTIWLGTMVSTIIGFLAIGINWHFSLVDDERELQMMACAREVTICEQAAVRLHEAQDTSKAEYMASQQALMDALNDRIESCEDRCGR